MKPLPVAVQLYSIREDLEKDFFGVLGQVRAMGFEGVEFAGFYGHGVEDVRHELRKLGLQAVSSHVPLDSFHEDPARVLEDHRILGCPFIAIPWLDEERRPGTPRWPEVVRQIRSLGEASQAVGIQLLYHNHDFEFVKLQGRYGLDRLYEEIPSPWLATELDTCWVKVAGLDPAAYLRQYAGRAPVVHLKDFVSGDGADGQPLYALIDGTGHDHEPVVGSRGTFDFRPLGQGVQDIPAILGAAEDAGTQWLIVEQDRSTQCPPLEAIRQSLDYLRTLGYGR